MFELNSVTRLYRKKRTVVKALNQVTLIIQRGDFIALRGVSGSGKTTLLMTIAAMLPPSKGQVLFEHKGNLYDMSARKRAHFRADNVGFIFQMFQLIPYLNILENIMIANQGAFRKYDQTEMASLLARVNLMSRAYHKPEELSTGEKQRVAIVRALYNSPKILLADEPTSNLDEENTHIVLNCLSDFHHNGGTVVMATQDKAASDFADREVILQNGQITSDQH